MSQSAEMRKMIRQAARAMRSSVMGTSYSGGGEKR
jgi:hypothetical protein